MNNDSISKVPSFDVAAITATIENALASAGLTTASGPMHHATDTIRRALGAAAPLRACANGDASVIDVVAREVPGRSTRTAAPTGASVVKPGAPGQFDRRTYSNRAGTRAYKLYVPTSKRAVPMPLVVMLHGCTQSPDDFAAGTQMNRLAEEHGFIVAYPEQTANANGSKCWNWFRAQDQKRDAGEPSLLAGITREIAANHPVDPRRIFVAGLSAGAAMAVVLGETYPELYAGVGVHSGLPYASAHDAPSAFAAMRGRQKASARSMSAASGAATQFMPTIVFHGDHDRTVGQDNGTEVVRQAVSAFAGHADGLAPMPVTSSGNAPRGRGYTKTVYADRDGRPAVESWVVHGAGHAWAGGDVSGSYTDRSGPDASAEMVRFFLGQTPPDLFELMSTEDLDTA